MVDTNSADILFPSSVPWVNKTEFDNVELEVVDGQLPSLSYGHSFFIAPAGDPNSHGLFNPSADGTPVFNGDAIIYRLDFDPTSGGVRLNSKIAKTPCFYSDQATFQNGYKEREDYKDFKYYDFGFARISPILGFRDQVNTAFLPMKFSEQEGYRLLITWDAGRPYEIDTKTLEVVTPIGKNTEWREQFPLPFPFPFVNTGAHSVFDPNDKKMYAINYGKSLEKFLPSIDAQDIGKLIEIIGGSIETIDKLIEILLNSELKELFQNFKYILESVENSTSDTSEENISDLSDLKYIIQLLFKLISGITEIKDFVRLICWDGMGDFKEWEVLVKDEDGNETPVRINETMHQIALTKQYVILMDTVFKVGIGQLYNHILLPKKQYSVEVNQSINSINDQIKKLLDYQESNDTFIYIINRNDLDLKQNTVIAKKITISLPAAHFLADYDDTDNLITLHLAHNTGWDPADPIRFYDEPVDRVEKSLKADDLCVGLSSGGMDINRLGKYTINMKTGQFQTSTVVEDRRYTWMTAIYTYNSIDGITLPDKLNNIYWISWGAWSNLLTQDIYDLYEEYRNREINAGEIVGISEEVKPVSLLCLNTDTMKIEDAYLFPNDVFGNSPQFIPRQQRNTTLDESKDGYIVCVINKGDDRTTPSEFWIFDATNLKQGPVCKLADKNKELKLGMTIHSTWLPKIEERKATYNIAVKEDYQKRVDATQDERVQDFFENEIYPHF